MSNSILRPAYRIQTPRLVIRCWNPVDAPLLKTAIDANLDHLRPWITWAHKEPEELAAKVEKLRRFRGQFDLEQDFIYGIFNPDESAVLGGTGLHTRVGEGALEIGYWIHKDYGRRGLATEASAALTRVAFEIHQVQRVEIHCAPENLRSAAVPRRLGYTHEGTLRRRYPFVDGQMQDIMMWTLFRDQYPSSPSASVEMKAFDAAGERIRMGPR